MTTPRFRCTALRRSGATEVRIVQAVSADAARERLIAAGLEPDSIEALGPSLIDGLSGRDWKLRHYLPTFSMPRRPAMLAIGLLASMPFTVAVGSWSLATLAATQNERLANASASSRIGRPFLSDSARRDLAGRMSRRTVSEIAARLFAVLPQNASINGVSSDADGRLKIEIDTPDPDRLRIALAVDPLLTTLSEEGQLRTDDGAIRVTLRGAAM